MTNAKKPVHMGSFQRERVLHRGLSWAAHCGDLPEGKHMGRPHQSYLFLLSVGYLKLELPSFLFVFIATEVYLLN